MDLDALRAQLTALDDELIELAARRQRLVSEIGKTKRGAGRATRDFSRERDVLTRAAERGRTLGLRPGVAEELLRALIRSSLTTQEQDTVAAHGHGDGKRALVIGGSGRMGAWFARFLAAQGFAVEIADPATGDTGFVRIDDWHDSALDHDLIVVAAPLRTSNRILCELAGRRPEGLVFDIGSLKSPLRAGLDALRVAGCRVTSVHPMFGPDTALLSNRHVIFVDAGCPDAVADARALFRHTMAEQVEMSLDDHDHTIAFVLGLSHALNIAFAAVLSTSGEHAPALARLSSTTFDRQLAVAGQVASENPHLYFEIQSLNAHGMKPLEQLVGQVTALRDMVRDGDEAAFVALMQSGSDYFATLRPRERVA